MRVIASLAAALAVVAGPIVLAGPAGAASVSRPGGQVDAAAASTQRAGFFAESYRGHWVMGWGRDESACAYIDGVQLVLYPVGGDHYLSALQAYQQERGVRSITRASARVLGEFTMVPPADPVRHCPVFVKGPPAQG
ncbi:tyrosinase family oxidase copper chaperone [Actinoplanes sp. NEAU-A12]|uniref:Tyrosinase family oxidase copper chaperone n=1 Tax=Actinoplanes sandaracinus TaxID=3045177 RepID=A0ABT6WVD8_9ACTN|nr:tyrosinase family oxidase copper chaperone [Actinoplanes sandaracinus]MDI6103654.1 tyrosinase family oxidase copper chaperone [Actinoplanes sandaracinus]